MGYRCWPATGERSRELLPRACLHRGRSVLDGVGKRPLPGGEAVTVDARQLAEAALHLPSHYRGGISTHELARELLTALDRYDRQEEGWQAAMEIQDKIVAQAEAEGARLREEVQGIADDIAEGDPIHWRIGERLRDLLASAVPSEEK